MRIFQSEQVINLRNVQVLLGKKRMATEFTSSQTILDYHAWDTMLECYQKYTPKPPNTDELKTALLSIWNDLPQEFIDKAIPSIQRARLRSCVAAGGGHFGYSV